MTPIWHINVIFWYIMNANQISKELVKTIRGRKSQIQLSQKLGFGGNQVYRWESGLRKISWLDFVALAKTCKCPLADSLDRLFKYNGKLSDTTRLTQFLVGDAKIVKVSQETMISRFAISKWLKGVSSPSLEEIILLIHHCQHALFEFLDDLVGMENVPSLRDEYAKRKAEKNLYYNNPVIDAVLCCLELKTYKKLKAHRDGFIATALGISIEEERLALSGLLAVDAIVTEAGKYKLSSNRPDLRGDFEGERQIRRYWYERAVRVINEAHSRADVVGLGCAVFPVSGTMMEKVRQEYSDFYFRLRSLLAQPEGEVDRIMAFDFMAFDISKKTGAG